MIKEERIRVGQIKDEFVRMTITGKIDDILREKHPIELPNIFQECEAKKKRKVVLLEGAAGSGKSTLSLHLAQQVSRRELFKEFSVAILVSLRDPEIQQAKSIADLLPRRDSEMAQQAAKNINVINGRATLFILDGWDELPSQFQRNSIFSQLIQPKVTQANPLHESAVIITSRPIASGDLHQLVSSRVEILGFTPKKLKEYFTQCLEGNNEAVETLLKRIHENPALESSCYLPLDASIMLHLFKSGNNTLPPTQYGIFSEFVLSCIFRNQNERSDDKNLSLESLQDLPDVVRAPFLQLCQIAYEGIMNNRVTFTDLPSDLNTLGLLQGAKSMVGRKKSLTQNFIHLSVQELLAALYMATQLLPSEQVSKLLELFDSIRFSAVFLFYSAITKLQTPGISDIINRIAMEYGVSQATQKNKTLLLSLLHSLYETQDISQALCESVAQYLLHGLNLSGITLSQYDCHCIGYFLSSICKTTTGQLEVQLSTCRITNQACKVLVAGLCKCLDTQSRVTTTLSLSLSFNEITDLSELSELLKMECVNALNLDRNLKISDQGVCTLAEKLKKNASLKSLKLVSCSLTSKGVQSLARVLTTNSSLEELHCVGAECDYAIESLAHALTVNHSLKVLHLGNCGITDKSLESLAKSLQHNSSLEELNIANGVHYSSTTTTGGYHYCNHYPNAFGTASVAFLGECLQKNTSLLKLTLPDDFESFVAHLEEGINRSRKKSALPLIKLAGE